MATSCSTQFIPDSFNQPRPRYEVIVNGNWRRHARRREQTSGQFAKMLLIYAVVIFNLVLVLGALYVARKYGTGHSLSSEMENRIKFLENRLTLLENPVGSSLTDHDSQRSKRAAEPIYSEGENQSKRRNKSNHTRKTGIFTRFTTTHLGYQLDREMKKTFYHIRVVQFTSSDPEIFASEPLKGVIGPWDEEFSNLHKMDSLGLKLVESGRKVAISRSGIYFIYSQITSPSKNSSSSYSINLISADDKTNSPISICSAPGELLPDGEVSCYTSIVRSLKPGDIIYLQQVEENMNINTESSSTYFGIILLSGI